MVPFELIQALVTPPDRAKRADGRKRLPNTTLGRSENGLPTASQADTAVEQLGSRAACSANSADSVS